MEFTPLRSISKKNYKFSIDTLSKTVTKSRLKSYLNKVAFLTKKIQAHSKISCNAKKRLFTSEITSASQIITPHFKNLIAETPHELNQKSDYKKCNLIAFGLSQPHKPLHVKAKEELQGIFNTFGVDSFDLSIDNDIPISNELLGVFGMIEIHKNTAYVNNPPVFSYIQKIKYYNKALQLKEQQGVIIPPLYRLELTISSNGKLKELFIPHDEINQITTTIQKEMK